MMATNYFFRNKAIYAIGIGLWMCVSCSNEELPMEFSDAPVSFSATSDWPDMQQDSRADGDDYFKTGDKMGVFAYYLPDGDEDLISSNAPDFMFNQEVTKQADGSWTYSPLKYWPNNPSDEVHFVAFSPLSSTTDAISLTSTNTQKGYPTINYTLKDGKTDLLASVPVSATRENNPLVLNFQHILGQVNVKVKFDEEVGTTWLDDEAITIDKVVLKNIHKTGTFGFAQKSGKFVWNTTGSPSDMTVTSGTNITKTTNNGGVVTGFPLYLIPTTISSLDVKLTTKVNYATISETLSCTLSSSGAVITSGSNTTITITINRYDTGFGITAAWGNTDNASNIVYDNNEIIINK